jgi:fatty acid-binding protein DegV
MPARKAKKQVEPEKDDTTTQTAIPRQSEEPPSSSPTPPSDEPDATPDTPTDESDDEVIAVPFGDKPSDTATLLLAAAEELGDQTQVRTGSGVFYVPRGLAKKAGVEVKDE